MCIIYMLVYTYTYKFLINKKRTKFIFSHCEHNVGNATDNQITVQNDRVIFFNFPTFIIIAVTPARRLCSSLEI